MKRKLRQELLHPLMGRLTTYGVGLYHEMWRLTNHPSYKDLWTEGELNLMKKKLKEFNDLLMFFSKMNKRLLK